MKVLDLFSGIGGFSVGLEAAGMQTAAFCEIDPFCQEILRKHWPETPLYSDIHTLNKEVLQNDGIHTIDVICGGFPCQPYSIAGRKKGTQDDRDLWPAMFRLIQELKPTWVIGENVANFTNMAFSRTKIDMESAGYQVQPFIIPACAVGAPHRRNRIWILAYSDGERLEEARPEQQATRDRGKIANSFTWYRNIKRIGDYFNHPSLPQPLVCRGRDGIPRRVDRLRALGNAVVPQIPEIIGRGIMNLQHQ